jgi:hypothetical protein
MPPERMCDDFSSPGKQYYSLTDFPQLPFMRRLAIFAMAREISPIAAGCLGNQPGRHPIHRELPGILN